MKRLDQSRSVVLVLLIYLLSGCTSVSTPVVTPIPSTLTPSPIPPTVTPKSTETQIPSPTSTPQGLLTEFADAAGDGWKPQDGTTCLPDYMDLVRITIFKTDDNGLKIIMNMVAPLPENFEIGNNGFDFLIYFGEIKPRSDVIFRVIPGPSSEPYWPLYGTGGSISPDSNFSIEIKGNDLIFNIGPQLVMEWPNMILVRFGTFFFPENSNTGCTDNVPDDFSDGIPIEIRP